MVCATLPAGQLRPEGARPACVMPKEARAICRGCPLLPAGLGKTGEGNRSVSGGGQSVLDQTEDLFFFLRYLL